MRSVNLRKKTQRIAFMLCVAAVSVQAAGCTIPMDISKPVEEAVSSVKENMKVKKQMDALDMPKEVESVSGGRYVYESLAEEDRKVYDQMLDAINSYEDEVTLSASNGQKLEDIFECIKADHGELFWVDSFCYTQYQRNGETQKLSFSPNYSMTKEQRDAMQRRIDGCVQTYLDGIEKDAGDYEKVCEIYRSLIEKVNYNVNAENNQNIISVFLDGETVCQGYASAMQYLMSLLGIPCVTVTGTAGGGPHAWNMVQLGGEWYYLDVTWGNSAYHDEEENNVKYVEYDYLNVTSEELLRTHSPHVKFTLPECTAVEYNYYVQTGKYFESFGEAEQEKIGGIFKEAYENGAHNISVKFSSNELCGQARQYFLSDYHIQDYCSGLESVYYNTDSGLNIFTVIFP